MDDTTAIITIPSQPSEKGQRGWRKFVSAINPDEKGGYAFAGEFASAGDRVRASVGAILISVDLTITGWDTSYKTGQRYAKEAADVTIYQVSEEGLQKKWTRKFKTATSVGGKTVQTQIAKLLPQKPDDVEIAVITAAQRPNRRQETCRWCNQNVYAGTGHIVGHGSDAVVEHWQKCPEAPGIGAPIAEGDPCITCGHPVTRVQARAILSRDTGKWSARHHPTCATPTETRPIAEIHAEHAATIKTAAANRAAHKQEQERQRRLHHAAKRARKSSGPDQTSTSDHEDRVRTGDVVNRVVYGSLSRRSKPEPRQTGSLIRFDGERRGIVLGATVEWWDEDMIADMGHPFDEPHWEINYRIAVVERTPEEVAEDERRAAEKRRADEKSQEENEAVERANKFISADREIHTTALPPLSGEITTISVREGGPTGGVGLRRVDLDLGAGLARATEYIYGDRPLVWSWDITPIDRDQIAQIINRGDVTGQHHGWRQQIEITHTTQ